MSKLHIVYLIFKTWRNIGALHNILIKFGNWVDCTRHFWIVAYELSQLVKISLDKFILWQSGIKVIFISV